MEEGSSLQTNDKETETGRRNEATAILLAKR